MRFSLIFLVMMMVMSLGQVGLADEKQVASLYIATDSGVLESRDNGASWNKVFERHSPAERQCLAVLADEDRVMVGTGGGLFWREQGQALWQQASGELGEKPIYFIQTDGQYWYVTTADEVYRLNKHTLERKKVFSLATAEGVEEVSEASGYLFARSRIKNLEISAIKNEIRLTLKNKILFSRDCGESWQSDFDSSKLPESLSKAFGQEPNISQVQSMAIEYANVNPSQVKRWHAQSAHKAWLPKLSLGVDRSATELFHWDTGANPDHLVRGKDYVDWSTSVSWDFGELIWNGDHTSIDLRSKLMAELRQDILEQVNRAYFERRRLQMALAEKDDSSQALKIEELTATLDGLTGGEFSRRISKP